MLLKSVPKPARRSAGAPSPKEPNLTAIRSSDILAWPAIGLGGVVMNGNFVLKEGFKMLQIYLTPSKQAGTGESEGDEDAVGITQRYEGSHPGNGVEIREFVQGALGEDWILISGTCRDNNKTVYGTKCSAMKLQPGYSDNNEGTMWNLVFEQYQRTDQVPYNYTGTLSFDEPVLVDPTAINLTVANRFRYQLEGSEVVDTAVEFASNELDHGQIVSLIGGGGAEPAVLSNGAGLAEPNIEVILAEGSDWVALKNATISLEVFKAGATTYLIEKTRTA
ncbi:hypothetical protein J0871_16895 [Salegentibacter sp. BDJ18]|uniref:hypothetical protein n=1 Tax=Salegentibacter sp. BDJ18 TaxID=2816376 RepID=UPI001AAF561A|nr:hypothetical protein [Salegentibacter sp. BDJ18]MBO2546096.1 hypothetical protein [Salegentibacter sp. BDJ18]